MTKQWKKSSRWRNAYRNANTRNKIRLWSLIDKTGAFIHVICEQDAERLMPKIAKLLTTRNPFVELI